MLASESSWEILNYFSSYIIKGHELVSRNSSNCSRSKKSSHTHRLSRGIHMKGAGSTSKVLEQNFCSAYRAAQNCFEVKQNQWKSTASAKETLTFSVWNVWQVTLWNLLGSWGAAHWQSGISLAAVHMLPFQQCKIITLILEGGWKKERKKKKYKTSFSPSALSRENIKKQLKSVWDQLLFYKLWVSF